jgi:hypothetical protein
MATYTKQLLSGSTNGKQVKVVATSSPGTTIHTAPAGTTGFDEVWIYAVNSDTSSRKLTIQWGETASPDGLVELTIPAEAGYTLVIPGLLIQNSLVISAFAETDNVILINGFVNRITP